MQVLTRAPISLQPLCLPIYCLGEASSKKPMVLLVLCGCLLPRCTGHIISLTAMNLSAPVWCKAELLAAHGGWKPWTRLKSEGGKPWPPLPPKTLSPRGQPCGPQIHTLVFSCHQFKHTDRAAKMDQRMLWSGRSIAYFQIQLLAFLREVREGHSSHSSCNNT